MLLDVLPALLEQNGGGVQLLVCGRANSSDSYAARCAQQMTALCAKYPNQFWASPHTYFDHGQLATLGADFGVMPSLYEPCGLVREEFFAAGTPLICSTVGALMERVKPYDTDSKSGEGLLFSAHSHGSLLEALQTALRLYHDTPHYEALRANAHAAACDVADTAWTWQCELQRLRACLTGVSDRQLEWSGEMLEGGHMGGRVAV